LRSPAERETPNCYGLRLCENPLTRQRAVA